MQGATSRAGRNVRGAATALLLGCSALASAVIAATLLADGGRDDRVHADRAQPVRGDRVEMQKDEPESKLTPHAVHVPRVHNLRAAFTPIAGGGTGGAGGGGSASGGGGDGGIAGGCPTEVQTYSGANFTGGEFVMQAGLVETEIAAVEYVVPPENFPLKIDLAEMIFTQLNASVGTTTEWSFMVWEGNPQTGVLVEVYESDNLILPHITMPPGTYGVNVQVSVDPTDPDQIIINANPSNSFTIGFRVDKHNNPPTSSCLCPCDPLPAGCGLGWTLPAVCCPPATNSNAFPTTDPTGLTNPSKNWVWARDCPGQVGMCAASAGWHKFNESGMPSGDWNMRVTYTPLACDLTFGACCKASGCQTMSNFDCAAENGVYQGANTSCASVTCPFGACCLPQGCQVLSNISCSQQGGTYKGNGVTCAAAGCPISGACCFGGPGGFCDDSFHQSDCEFNGGTFLGGSCNDGGCSLLLGACCVPATGQCAQDVEQETCDVVGGNWQGMGSNCANIICFPIGACCLPDGSCGGSMSPEECAGAGGNFQGHQTQCGSINCPQPTGACCLSSGNCVVSNNANCNAFGGQWKGGGSNCLDTNGSGQADACEDPAPPCPADLTGSGSVGVPDLLELLAAWGPCPASCAADLTGNGSVGVPDLLELLAAWGPCE